jgi:hypothetical protein
MWARIGLELHGIKGRPASFCDWVYSWQMIVNLVQPVLSWTFRRIQLGAWKVQSAKTSQRNGYSYFCRCNSLSHSLLSSDARRLSNRLVCTLIHRDSNNDLPN